MKWICPVCGTNNDEIDECFVCGAPRPSASGAPLPPHPTSRPIQLTANKVRELSLTSGRVEVPPEYTVIGVRAFAATDIVSITLHAGVKKIYKEAFLDCKSLQNVICPHVLDSVGDRAFYNCRALPASGRPRANGIGADAFGSDPLPTPWTCDNCGATNPGERGVCVSCGERKGVAHPRWTCAFCGTNNYAAKTACVRCGKAKGSVPPPWTCDNCGASNSYARFTCVSCGESRGVTRPRWTCAFCGTNNYAAKTVCVRCGRRKGTVPPAPPPSPSPSALAVWTTGRKKLGKKIALAAGIPMAILFAAAIALLIAYGVLQKKETAFWILLAVTAVCLTWDAFCAIGSHVHAIRSLYPLVRAALTTATAVLCSYYFKTYAYTYVVTAIGGALSSVVVAVNACLLKRTTDTARNNAAFVAVAAGLNLSTQIAAIAMFCLGLKYVFYLTEWQIVTGSCAVLVTAVLTLGVNGLFRYAKRSAGLYAMQAAIFALGVVFVALSYTYEEYVSALVTTVLSAVAAACVAVIVILSIKGRSRSEDFVKVSCALTALGSIAFIVVSYVTFFQWAQTQWTYGMMGVVLGVFALAIVENTVTRETDEEINGALVLFILFTVLTAVNVALFFVFGKNYVGIMACACVGIAFTSAYEAHILRGEKETAIAVSAVAMTVLQLAFGTTAALGIYLPFGQTWSFAFGVLVALAAIWVGYTGTVIFDNGGIGSVVALGATAANIALLFVYGRAYALLFTIVAAVVGAASIAILVLNALCKAKVSLAISSVALFGNVAMLVVYYVLTMVVGL